jgi:general secretion pathway protein E
MPAAPSAHVALEPSTLARARAAALAQRRPVVHVLEEEIGLDEDGFVRALGEALAFRTWTMDQLRQAAAAFDALPLGLAVQTGCAPLRTPTGLVIAIDDPFDADAMDRIDARVVEPFEWSLAHGKAIHAYLQRHEEVAKALDSVAPAATPAGAGTREVAQLSLQTIQGDDSPVVKLVNSTLYDGLKSGASDIHFETDPEGLVIKYRLDGVLSKVARPLGAEMTEQVLSRIKVMSELDIAERRIPQDGRFQLAFQERKVDFRVSIMPSIHGEDAVLRVLDRQSLADTVLGLRLDALGLNPDVVAAVRRLALMPYGMLLVTGPTGSGKTTTLYAAVTEINLGHDKIITIEDPVEYQLPGVLQIPVNERKGLTFARGLRSILRHDPDKILVGEVRDPETAQIAVQAALTGHLVLTTVHANSVFDVIGRIGHMGVEPFSFAAATNGIVAQRLLRLLCPNCAEAARPDAEQLRASGLEPGRVRGFKFKVARGCGHCRGSGYKGRRAVAELLIFDDEIRDLIVNRRSLGELRRAAASRGLRVLREAAMDLVREGITSLQEVNRVTALG